MPTGPIPPDVIDFLRRPNPCVVATIRPDGELHTVATWYDVEDDGTVLLNMDVSRLRLRHLRADPRVALTVLDERSWYSHASLIGRAREIRPDPGLVDIDRLAVRYTGKPFRNREHARWSAIVEVTRWHVWELSGRKSASASS
jgi:PPOX class probable F420-dependent enzyme